MKEKDEEDAIADYSRGSFSWFLRNVRPVKPFAVLGQLHLFEMNEIVQFMKQLS